MSYGAPWERGVGAADTMPQRDMEVPGLVPDVGEVGLNTKEARKRRSQRGRRQRRREEEASRKARSKEDEGRCLDVLAEAMEENRRGLSVVSRGLDLCESTICNDIASVRTWVVDAMKVQDNMIERVADKLIAAVASILESQRAHRVEEKAVEGVGVGSGGHDVQVMAASAVEGAAPMAAAVKKRNRRKTAAKKTVKVGDSILCRLTTAAQIRRCCCMES